MLASHLNTFQNHLWTLVVSSHHVALQLAFRATTFGVFLFIALLWLFGSHSSSSQCLLFPSPWLEVLPFGAKRPASYFGHVCSCHLFPTSEKCFSQCLEVFFSHTPHLFFFSFGKWLGYSSLFQVCQTPPHPELSQKPFLEGGTLGYYTITSGVTGRVTSQAMLRNVSPSWWSNWTASLECFRHRAVCCLTEHAPCWQLLHKQDWEGTLWVESIILCACCSSQKLHVLKSFLNPATKGWFTFYTHTIREGLFHAVHNRDKSNQSALHPSCRLPVHSSVSPQQRSTHFSFTRP